MQQRQQAQSKRQRLYSASEVAEFEYCPLVWWHSQYEPLAQADTEELFARLVELEHDHGSEAPALPEYQVVEQLLVRKGAFDEGLEQHLEHADEVEEVEAGRGTIAINTSGNLRRIVVITVVLLIIAVLLIVAAIILKS